ncbi:MAG: hypothetical protein DRP42_07385 [Tenericutes bacterium]|nr:MAG: hypothetical protein DRP42_07385 [Mycoplasmatota bacterium]
MDSVHVDIEANKHLKDFFSNNAVPTTIVTTKNDVSEDNLKRLNNVFKSQLKGSGNQFKTIFMSDGFEPKQMGYAPQNLALDVVREEARRAICAGFGVPMPMAGASESANYATADIQRKSLYTENIIPRSIYISGVINAELVWLIDPTVEFRFAPEKLDVMQEDKEKTATYLRGFVDSKILKPEVVAKEFGYSEDDVPEPVANPFLMPQNGTESNLEPKPQQPDEEEDNPFQKALGKYKKKVVRLMKEGKDHKADFNSKYIASGIITAIKTRLETVEDLGDVVKVFEDFGV